MTAYYNEVDKNCVQWLRNLIAAKLIAPGDVDDRSIADVQPADVAGYRQCHWFAGIGGWSLAARLAGWPDDRELWTGSCPCQPFSAAGKRKGVADARHLWPEFARLVGQCRPAVVAGEQVASKDGRLWLAGVRADLEALGYAVGAGDLCAAGVGAPHIRQRLYWVADAGSERRQQERRGASGYEGANGRQPNGDHIIAGHGAVGGMGQPEGKQVGNAGLAWGQSDAAGRLVDADSAAAARFGTERVSLESEQKAGRPGDAGAWADFDVIGCADGKARRVESGTFPLAHGIPNRMGRLRGYGNSITPQVAAEFLSAYMDCRP